MLTDQVTALAPEHVKIAGVRVALQPLLYLQGQAVHAAPHVGVAGGEPHAHARGNRDHRRTSACTTAAASPGGVDGGMRMQATPLNWISIASPLRDPMPGPQSASAVTTTAAKPAPPLPSSRRQR